MRHAMTLLAFAFVAPAVAGPFEEVQVRDLGNGRYSLSIVLTGTPDPAIGQQALVPKAEELCGALSPQFGHYRFESFRPLAGAPELKEASLEYTQDIECMDVALPSTIESTVPPAPATPPTAEDESEIRRRTLAYLEAKDTGDFDRSHAMVARQMASHMTPEGWRAPRTAFNAAAGEQAHREVIRLTWYDNPVGAPIPGRYVAADYRASFPSTAFYCGYVMWLRQQDGGYLIVREEEGQATPDVVAGITPAAMAGLRLQLGCRD